MNEKIQNPEYKTQKINLSPEEKKEMIEIKSEPENFEKQQKRMRQYLNDALDTLFNAKTGGAYARINEKVFSGDAASIYILVSIKNEKGEEVPELVKVGWGEFSKETFESDRYPTFRNFPYDIYCVSQKDSYFADEKLKQQMVKNPKKFLSEHSLFVASHGKVQETENIDFHTRRLNKDIKAIPYEEILRTVRNQIINEYTTPEEFASFLRELPDDPTELGKYTNNLEYNVDWRSNRELETIDEKTKADIRKKQLMHILWGMGTEKVGVAVGEKKAMESILALKKQFDFKTNSFK